MAITSLSQLKEPVSSLIDYLNEPRGFFPGPIVEIIKRGKQESSPALLAVLEEVLEAHEGYDHFEYTPHENRCDHFIALYILSYFREQKAFPYVIRFAELAPPWSRTLLGDHLTENLASWIISTYNGDFQAIKNVIENKNCYSYSRRAALRSLLGLFAQNMLSRQEIIDYYRELVRSPTVEDVDIAGKLALCATHLYPEELYDDIMNLFERDLIDYFDMNKKTVDDMLSLGKEACLKRNVYTSDYLQPITDVLKHVSFIHLHDETLKKPGRNEPCYCDGYKKFKKCCYPWLTK